MNINTSNLIKNIGKTLGRQIASSLIGLITIIIIARHFGPEGNGMLAVAILLPTILTTFLNLGMSSANIYFLSSGKIKLKKILLSNIKINSIISILGIIIGMFLLNNWHELLFPNIKIEVLYIALFLFPINIFNSFLLSILQGLQDYNSYNLITLGQSFISLILVLVVINLESSEISYVIFCQISSAIITLFFAARKTKHSLTFIKNSNSQEYPEKKLIAYGLKSHIGNIIAFINNRSDLLILNSLLSTSSVGIYSIAMSIGERLWLISSSAGTVLFPYLAELSENEEKRRSITPTINRLTLLITLFFSLLLALIGYPLLIFLFGSEYKYSYILLITMLPGFILSASSQILANDISARGKPELNILTSIVGLTTSVTGNILMIPILGVLGAALSFTTSALINNILKNIIYSRISGNNWRVLFLINETDKFLIKRITAIIFKKIIKNN